MPASSATTKLSPVFGDGPAALPSHGGRQANTPNPAERVAYVGLLMRHVLSLSSNTPRTDRPEGFEDDICFSPGLVETVLAEFTSVGDVVFDPFSGFGTTLLAAERMDRQPLGFELLPDRVAFVRQ